MGLRLGLFFIIEVRLVLSGQSDINCVRGRHSHGPLLLNWGRVTVKDRLVLQRRTTPGPLWRV